MCRSTSSLFIFALLGPRSRKERECDREHIWRTIGWNFSNLVKKTDIWVQEAPGVPNKVKRKRLTLRHIILKCQKLRTPWKWKSLSHVQLLATTWAIQFMEFSRSGILLEWVAVPFSRGSSQPRDQTQVSCFGGRFFISWATYRENVKCSGRQLVTYKRTLFHAW